MEHARYISKELTDQITGIIDGEKEDSRFAQTYCFVPSGNMGVYLFATVFHSTKPSELVVA